MNIQVGQKIALLKQITRLSQPPIPIGSKGVLMERHCNDPRIILVKMEIDGWQQWLMDHQVRPAETGHPYTKIFSNDFQSR